VKRVAAAVPVWAASIGSRIVTSGDHPKARRERLRHGVDTQIPTIVRARIQVSGEDIFAVDNAIYGWMPV